jgi:type IV pilus assembly protein PilB
MARRRLGDVLRERAHIPVEIIDQMVAEQAKSTMLLGELLLQRNIVKKEQLIDALQEVTRFRYLDPRTVGIDKGLLELLPYASAAKYCAIPVARQGNDLVVVMAEPQNLRQLDEMRFLVGCAIKPRLGLRTEIEEAIANSYPQHKASAAELPFDQIDVSDIQFFSASKNERAKQAMEDFQAELKNDRHPAVRLVSAILCAAVTRKASDIHVEPQSTETIVRVRIDGVLRELTRIPLHLTTLVLSRIKILADLDIAERRVPQDGRFLVQVGGTSMDLRVSTLPTHEGEKIVMRLLDATASRVSFSDLGFPAETAAAFTQIAHQPQGLILVTGPTGSGKTTTLYAALNMRRSRSVNIVTIEDPVEYKMAEINQVQINTKQGLTFAGCMRSILRQDPNIIMVGEIRDAETAEIALQAAQTGHLVLSTLHTNDSLGAIDRLLDLGMPPFMVASSLSGVLAQRLVRKLCECRKQAVVPPDTQARLRNLGVYDFGDTFYIPVGCPRCENGGYKGRVGIYELLVIGDQLRSAIRGNTHGQDMRFLARSAGLKTMAEDAIEKVRAGLTSLDEVLRVVPFDQSNTSACRECQSPLAPNFQFCPYCGMSVREDSPAPYGSTPAGRSLAFSASAGRGGAAVTGARGRPVATHTRR